VTSLCFLSPSSSPKDERPYKCRRFMRLVHLQDNVACLTDPQLIARRNDLRQKFLNHFNSHNLDVILCPTGPAPAQPLGTTKYWSYTSMFNLLDWPAAVIPTGLSVDESDIEQYPSPENDDERHLSMTCEYALISSFHGERRAEAQILHGTQLARRSDCRWWLRGGRMKG
jgi:hypothetical protein